MTEPATNVSHFDRHYRKVFGAVILLAVGLLKCYIRVPLKPMCM